MIVVTGLLWCVLSIFSTEYPEYLLFNANGVSFKCFFRWGSTCWVVCHQCSFMAPILILCSIQPRISWCSFPEFLVECNDCGYLGCKRSLQVWVMLILVLIMFLNDRCLVGGIRTPYHGFFNCRFWNHWRFLHDEPQVHNMMLGETDCTWGLRHDVQLTRQPIHLIQHRNIVRMLRSYSLMCFSVA